MKIEVSHGEIVDKMSILQIKAKKIKETVKLQNVKNEISHIEECFLSISSYGDPLYLKLKTINEKLWKIEDDIREKEKQHLFNEEFIALARSVYKTNDERASVKNAINMETNSTLVEEKSYVGYGL